MSDAAVEVTILANADGVGEGVDEAKARLNELSAEAQRLQGALKAVSPSDSSEKFAAMNAALQAYQQLMNQAAAATQQNAVQMRASGEAIQGQIKSLEDAERLYEAHLNAEVKLRQITEQQKDAAVEDSLAKQQAKIDALYGHEAEIAGLTVDKIEAIRNKQAAFDSSIALKIQEAQDRAAEATLRSWDNAANRIENAFNSQLRGLLEGTTSWNAAMKKVLENLVIKGIEGAEHMAAQWLVAEAQKTAASQAGAAARTAAGAGEASAGIAQDAMAALKTIWSSAAAAFAGVFGFLAPVMGPAAAGPAAGAEATVLGAAGMVASADIGMWQVPQDMLTMVHHNELIMPAAEAGALRGLLSGAAQDVGPSAGAINLAPTTHFHVNAIDGASVGQWVRNNGSHIAKALDDAVRHGAALGARRLSVR